jgi:LCP family protein required for cell wall assembly
MALFRRGGGSGYEPPTMIMPPPEPEGPPRLARRMWIRFVVAGLLIILLTGGATATATLLQVKDIGDRITGQNHRLKVPQLVRAQVGGPQTILLIGSDVRKADRLAHRPGRSDTMMLVRLDPDRNKIAVLSIPRDLKVNIVLPDGRSTTDKFNAAYSYGGARQVVKTIHDTLGVSVNHVFDIDFRGFRRLVDYLGGVYVDIDRRYFNDNSGYGDKYATIDVKPGYQKLFGQDALDYVRFRHEDSDLVRAARQQDFLAQIKVQNKTKSLFGHRTQLADIVGKYTHTDLRGTGEILELLKLGVFTAGNEVSEVKFQTQSAFENQISYLESSPQEIKQTVKEFEAAEGSKGARGTLKGTEAQREAARRRRKRFKTAGVKGLENAQKEGEDQVVAVAAKVPYPMYYPKLRTSFAVYSDIPRVYTIHDQHGHGHTAYRMVIKKGLVGEYYGVQGMNWTNPPILDQPHDKQKLGRRTFEIYYDGDRIARIAFQTKGAVYWLTNTLLRSNDNKQMFAMAKSLTRLGH